VTATIAAFGPFVLRTLDLTLLRAGGVLVPAAGAAALGMFLAGRWSRRGNRLREVAVLYALGSGAVLAAAAVHNPWLFGLVAIPLAFSVGGAQPLLNASLLDVSHSADQTGTVLGWLFFAEGLGSVTGPVIIGAVISVSGVRDAVVAISILDACIVALASSGSNSATGVFPLSGRRERRGTNRLAPTQATPALATTRNSNRNSLSPGCSESNAAISAVPEMEPT